MKKDEILKIVKDKNIELTRFLYTDNDGVTRGYSTTTENLMGDLDSGHTYSIAMPFFTSTDDSLPNSRFGPVGEILAMPDIDTFTPIPYAENSAAVICDFLDLETHEPSLLCPRSILKSTLAHEKTYEVVAAFENEFYFVLKDEEGNIVTAEDSLMF